MPKVASHPFGHGIGGAATNLGYVQPGGITTIDSYYLTLLMDLGVLGFVVYFAIFLRGIWISARTAVQHQVEGELGLLLPMSVALTNFVIVKSVFSQDANHPVVFMLLGGIVALSYRASRAGVAAGPRATQSPRARFNRLVVPQLNRHLGLSRRSLRRRWRDPCSARSGPLKS